MSSAPFSTVESVFAISSSSIPNVPVKYANNKQTTFFESLFSVKNRWKKCFVAILVALVSVVTVVTLAVWLVVKNQQLISAGVNDDVDQKKVVSRARESSSLPISLPPLSFSQQQLPYTTGVCKASDFHCDNGTCLQFGLRCNLQRDCSNGEDELFCACSDYLKVFAQNKICDGLDDCPDGSDEVACAVQVAKCVSGYFSCGSEVQNKNCIASENVCDGIADCANAEDERDCARLVPALSSSPDDRHNWRIPNGFLSIRIGRVFYVFCISANVFTRPSAKTRVEQMLNSYANYGCTASGFDLLLNFTTHYVDETNRVSGPYFVVNSLTIFSSDFRRTLSTRNSCNDGYLLNISCSIACHSTPACQKFRKTRIVGGTAVPAFCFPWAAALYMAGDLKCMAVLLSESWLLTAAHCFTEGKRRKYWLARLGAYRLHSVSPYEVLRVIDGVVLHPNFTDRPIYTNDIALLHMSEPVQMSGYIHPPCFSLPANQEPLIGARCTVIGWGAQQEEEASSTSDELLQTKLVAISRLQCNHSSAFDGQITMSHLCFSNENNGNDACRGDSGGPLLCPFRPQGSLSRPVGSLSSFYLAGITSQGYGCGHDDTPSIWTSVSHHTTWIRSYLNANSTVRDMEPVGVGDAASCAGFRCRLGQCLYPWWRCNGAHECSAFDFSDEQNCDRMQTQK